MDDDDFGADADFLAALAAADVAKPSQPAVLSAGPAKPAAAGQQLAVAQRPTPATRVPIQQPTPQRIERPGAGIVQPTPQVLPGPPGTTAGSGRPTVVPSSGSTILVSPRQKNNPVLSQLRTVAWEYSDIVADYGLGTTTCALFLSLKYHRLHPEYIYARIQGLQGRYQLRVLLTLVDIDGHEEPLRELAKTSLVNQMTLLLCWSVAEAARYLELYKTFEHATGFAAIRGQQAAGYAERLVQFATVPRAINKADAVALVSAFGSVRRAVLAEPEQLALVTGWGEKKVQGWRRAVEAPFRVQKTKARSTRPRPKPGRNNTNNNLSAVVEAETPETPDKVDEPPAAPAESSLSDGVAAALARLRDVQTG
ncbi:mating-type switching protein swi10 [Grosmannia clavigera kw1407]|uniref:Mating-type switching protein swi10 n=1 Tax=Grosmannia clavigera (strain kw1407 / UAMH 11150) TaxID=655863 RepID=F0XHN8_GROCL|nr:mating-type switching protein swi10 [Grosmannia clavigera kw1407]EFX02677.1 mating-type switching protein swi10 [Grosmannia clavigera kw1407]